MTKKSLAPAYPPLEFADDETDAVDFDDLDSSEPNESVLYDAIQEAIDDLASKGEIVDSGLRRWSLRTGEYQIVWMVPPWKRN
jgi:hypothetical protein